MASRIVKYPVATKTQNENGSLVTRYHGTPVVSVHADGSFTLKTGGWHTATTKHRMNQYGPFRPGDGIFQRNFGWYVRLLGKDHEFADGMTIKYLQRVVEEVEIV